MRPRTRGSVKFDPYYKVEVWGERNYAWRPVQRRYATEAAAIASLSGEHRARILCVTDQGYALVSEHHVSRSDD